MHVLSEKLSFSFESVKNTHISSPPRLHGCSRCLTCSQPAKEQVPMFMFYIGAVATRVNRRFPRSERRKRVSKRGVKWVAVGPNSHSHLMSDVEGSDDD